MDNKREKPEAEAKERTQTGDGARRLIGIECISIGDTNIDHSRLPSVSYAHSFFNCYHHEPQ